MVARFGLFLSLVKCFWRNLMYWLWILDVVKLEICFVLFLIWGCFVCVFCFGAFGFCWC